MTRTERELISRIIGGLWALSTHPDAMVSSASADMAEMLEEILNKDEAVGDEKVSTDDKKGF